MIVELGAFALVLAFVLSIAQTALSAAGARRPVLAGAGEGAAYGAFLAMAVTFGALLWAFVNSDFSVANVAGHSHTAKPLLYKIAGAWGSHEGSMVFWCLVLTGYGAAMARFGASLPGPLRARALAVQGVLGVLFLGYTLFASNPLARLIEAPVEGRSLNPLLQDPALAFHPPFLYFGYVGFSVVFSLAVAALVGGRVDAAWARWVRPWTLAAWSFLTVGITLGAFWAYYELGWGGWWGWDPVENASFMPWLMATALLHSAIVTEKRGALPGWTIFLALSAFTFSMLGAFLVRSGVLTSVHAFAVDPARGMLLLGILGIAAGAGFALFAWRAPSLQPGGLFAPVSRESTLFFNNIVLMVSGTVVLGGTLFPLIYEAIFGQPATVGPPYFNLLFGALFGLALLVLPFGPMLSWKRADALGTAQRLWAAALVAALLGGLTLLLVDPINLLSAFGLALGFWLILGSLVELAERVRLFRVPAAEALRRFGGLPRGAFGATLAHAGLGVFVLGAVFEQTWKVETAEVLSPGRSLALGQYELILDKVSVVDGPNYLAERAVLQVRQGGRTVCEAAPERRFFPAGGQTTQEVAICQQGLDQVYVTVGDRRPAADGQPGWLVRGYMNPWVLLIFLGPVIMALGGVVSLSDRRLRLAVGRRSKEAAA